MLAHAHDGRIDHLHRVVVSGGQCFHKFVSWPANEAIAASVWSKVLWQIAPRRPRTQDPQDAIEHATIIYTRMPGGLSAASGTPLRSYLLSS
jgi:hypothetical protein